MVHSLQQLNLNVNPVAVYLAPPHSGSRQPAAFRSPAIQALARQLAAVSPGEQKQIIGERIYPLVQDIRPGVLFNVYIIFVHLYVLINFGSCLKDLIKIYLIWFRICRSGRQVNGDAARDGQRRAAAHAG